MIFAAPESAALRYSLTVEHQREGDDRQSDSGRTVHRRPEARPKADRDEARAADLISKSIRLISFGVLGVVYCIVHQIGHGAAELDRRYRASKPLSPEKRTGFPFLSAAGSWFSTRAGTSTVSTASRRELAAYFKISRIMRSIRVIKPTCRARSSSGVVSILSLSAVSGVRRSWAMATSIRSSNCASIRLCIAASAADASRTSGGPSSG